MRNTEYRYHYSFVKNRTHIRHSGLSGIGWYYYLYADSGRSRLIRGCQNDEN